MTMNREREIKFRVWDNVDYMSKPFTLRDIQGNKTQFASNVVVMQFTGLKDKNGKEIYEGDIIVDTLTGMESQVKFGRCKKFAFNGWYVENEGMDYTSAINGDYDTNRNSQIEIIGNVFEHPHLLK